MNYLYDTNILVYIIKEHAAAVTLEAEIDKDATNLRIISIVSKAEMESLAHQRGWGEQKIIQLHNLLDQFLVVPIDSEQIIKAYADIDAFSQGRHATIKSKFSSRNMGKNDLWIAATAFVTGSTLITSDGDFDHLNDTFFPLIKFKA